MRCYNILVNKFTPYSTFERLVDLMLKNLVPRETVELVEHTIEFTENGSGFSFKATPTGEVILENKDQEANYQFAIAHPELFTDEYNKFRTRRRHYTENAHGTCTCGAQVELYNQYQGACQCPRCDRWYNLFGQELISPEYWED